ncbi:MAG: hypothetical protein HYS74_02380 [Parcubacteria group bacterium]|nr:hypothetical protein [Parcubacteria group bacterium]
MERVKVFYARNGAGQLEKNINEWLDSMGDKIEITRTMQDASGRMDHHVTITIFYKTK